MPSPRPAVEDLVATMEREPVEREQRRAMSETVARSRVDPPGALAPQGRSPILHCAQLCADAGQVPA
ncbi:hypothetical protein [Rhodobaculum claviforme]|uniref:hypothetical protein n=1 Tax=Rhodobaculum claviforme TaxID=1549854 RepID=UPI001912A311|nr:hypothetical protein [Rhodobaculum claviforme]